MTYKQFSYYHIHHGLTKEKFGREEVRLAVSWGNNVKAENHPTIASRTGVRGVRGIRGGGGGDAATTVCPAVVVLV